MKLYLYQKQIVRELEGFNGRSLLAGDMGIGKTLIALAFLRRNRKQRLPAIVVCPASVKYNWLYEATELMGMKAAVIEGRTVTSVPDADIIIINYDILKVWLDRLQRFKPKTIISDECQALSNEKSQRSKAFKQLCRGVPNILALSGTPFLNRPIELFHILSIIRPDIFRSKWRFAGEFTQRQWTPWGWKFEGAKNKIKLHQLLTDTCMIRKRKQDVLKDLPSKVRKIITLPISKPAEYEHASTDFLGWLGEQDPSKVAKAMRAESITKMNYLMQLAARLKAKAIVEWINRFLSEEPDEKLVIFGRNRKMLNLLERRCNGKSVRIDGSVSARNRKTIVNQFQTDPDTRLLIGNLQAAGVGITLTAASNVVFVQLAWRPGDHTQGEDRCHRIGTTKTVFCWYLVAYGTIEEELCKIIQRKQRDINSVLDGRIIRGDLNVHDQLMRALARK